VRDLHRDNKRLTLAIGATIVCYVLLLIGACIDVTMAGLRAARVQALPAIVGGLLAAGLWVAGPPAFGFGPFDAGIRIIGALLEYGPGWLMDAIP